MDQVRKVLGLCVRALIRAMLFQSSRLSPDDRQADGSASFWNDDGEG